MRIVSNQGTIQFSLLNTNYRVSAYAKLVNVCEKYLQGVGHSYTYIEKKIVS